MPSVVLDFQAQDKLSSTLDILKEKLEKMGDASEHAGKKHEGMAEEFIKGEAVVEIAKKGFEILSEQITDCIKEFANAEVQDAKLNAALQSTGGAAGMTKKGLEDLAEGLAKTTTASVDAIKEAEALTLTFTNVHNNVFPEVMKQAANVSAALGTDLKSAAMTLGSALNNPEEGMNKLRSMGIKLTEQQKDQIKTMQESGNVAGAQAVILGELEKRFGGAAAAVKNTFQGAMTDLNKSMEETREAIGGAAAAVGMDMVKAMTSGVDKMREFISSAEGAKAIGDIAGNVAASFRVMQTVFSDIGKTFQDTLGKTINSVKDSLSQLNSKGGDSLAVFMYIDTMGKLVGNNFKIVGQIISGLVQNIVNVINVIKDAASVMIAFFDAASGKGKWEDVGKAFETLGAQVKKTAGDVVDNTSKMVGLFADSVKTILAPSKDGAKQLQDQFTKTRDEISDKVSKSLHKDEDETKKSTTAQAAAYDDMKKKATSAYDDIGKAATAFASQVSGVGGDLAAPWLKAFSQINNAFSKCMSDMAKDGKVSASSMASAIGDTVGSMVSAITSTVTQYLDNQVKAYQDAEKAEEAAIDAKAAHDIELLENGGMTHEEALKKQQANLQKQLAAETDAKNKTAIQDKLTTTSTELAKLQITKTAEAEKTKAQQQAHDKEAQMKLASFYASQGAATANVWIQYAIGLATAWASAMQLGPIAGPIMGGVLTGLLSAEAGVATGLIWAQQPPSFATGVDSFEGGMAMVHKDELLTALPKGASVFTKSETREILSQGGGDNFSIGELHVHGVQNADDLIYQLNQIKRREGVTK